MRDKLILVSEKRLRELLKHEKEIIDYCKDHTDYMWSASILGILLNCDFRESKDALREYRISNPSTRLEDEV